MANHELEHYAPGTKREDAQDRDLTPFFGAFDSK